MLTLSRGKDCPQGFCIIIFNTSRQASEKTVHMKSGLAVLFPKYYFWDAHL